MLYISWPTSMNIGFMKIRFQLRKLWPVENKKKVQWNVKDLENFKGMEEFKFILGIYFGAKNGRLFDV